LKSKFVFLRNFESLSLCGKKKTYRSELFIQISHLPYFLTQSETTISYNFSNFGSKVGRILLYLRSNNNETINQQKIEK